MQDAILNFPKQFHWRPKIENGPLKKYKKFVVAGMGGSHLAGDIIKSLRPELDIVVHSDYGLPIGLPPFLIPSTSLRADKEGEKGEFSSPTPSSSPPRAGGENKRSQRRGVLVIASSYSGNTEETIDAFEKAVAENLPVAAIAIGGKLLELAKKHSVPYIQLPDTGIQPRSALGFSMMAMLKLMKQNELLKAARELSQIVRPHNLEQSGKTLAERLKNFVPVIYSSTRNAAVAYNWKIKLNETGKIPAFYNIFPELNHNEMTGFSAAGGPLPDRQAGASGGDFSMASALSEKFYFIFLKDPQDRPQIQKRMDITKKLYEDRGLPVEMIEMKGDSALEKIFNSLLLADWVALYTAEIYGLEPEQVPMVEEFKKLIK